MLQPIISGVVAAITGFASAFAIVIAGLGAVGATPDQAASGLLVVCLASALLGVAFSLRYRLPLSFTWSTPGAALLVAAGDTSGGYPAAVGAFLVCGVLIVLTGLWPWLGRLMTGIPAPLAGAMLAGILFPICLAPVTAAVALPTLVLPVLATWLLLSRVAPRWAVPAAVLVTAGAVAVVAGGDWLSGARIAPELTPVLPQWDPLVVASLGVPLFVVTMAGQNIPGFAVLATFGYSRPPVAPILVGSGLLTAAGAFGGGHAVNLAALSAALTAGPDAHRRRDRRWIAALACALTYVPLGLAAPAAAALVEVAPPTLITAAAGLALLGAFVTGLVSAFEQQQHRVAAAVTFLVVASGLVIAGIGSAFWGLLAGGAVMIALRRRRPA